MRASLLLDQKLKEDFWKECNDKMVKKCWPDNETCPHHIGEDYKI